MARSDPDLNATVPHSAETSCNGERGTEGHAFPIWPGVVLTMLVSILFGAAALDRWVVDFMGEGDQLLFAYTGLLFAILIATLGVFWVILFGFNRSPGK